MKCNWLGALIALVVLLVCSIAFSATPTVTASIDRDTFNFFDVYNFEWTPDSTALDTVILYKDNSATFWNLDYLWQWPVDSCITVQCETAETVADSNYWTIDIEMSYVASPSASIGSDHWKVFKTISMDSTLRAFDHFDPFATGAPGQMRITVIEDSNRVAPEDMNLWLVVPKPENVK